MVNHHVSPVIIYYKLLTGIVELLFGLGFLFLGRNIATLYARYAIKEFLEDPHDIFITLVQKIAPTLVHYHTYLIVTMIVFGVVKTIGAIALFFDKEWGLDILVLFFFIMLPFDLYTLFSLPTMTKTLYFLVNVLITLYLVEFKPHMVIKKYVKHLRKRI